MTRKAFWISGWAALMFGALAALAAVMVVVIGTLALTGRVTYPVDIGLGPFSVHDEVSLPVTAYEDICQKASVILLLAEAFRHGATVEAEHRLTV
jgi:hypothetical protein